MQICWRVFLFMLPVSTKLRWSLCSSFVRKSGSVLAFQTEVRPPRSIGYRLFSENLPQAEISPSDHGTEPLLHLDRKTGFHPFLKDAVRSKGLVEPTPIQMHAIPLLMKGYDVLASASTGSGKTFMFVFPLLNRLLTDKKTSQYPQPRALILNPTRELAMQTASVIKSLQLPRISVGMAVGGMKQHDLKVDILVGTPGRVLQLCDERRLQLRQVESTVIDESDRMLDLGFEPQLQRISRLLSNPERQTVLCSATFPEAVQRVASEYLKDSYYFVAAGRVGGLRSNIDHQLVWKNKATRVQDVLQSEDVKTLLFANTKAECERLGAVISNSRVVTGDKSQDERNRAVANLVSGRDKLLIATDVAARGLDVPDIGLVVQADAPRDVDTWVHRVGRTGRGVNATGTAITFLNAANMKIAGPMIELLQIHPGVKIPQWLFGMAHVARARELDELGAIAAGGGGLNSPENLSVADNTQYSSQDFRRTAQEGSWGSSRETTFASFDQDAYSSSFDELSEGSEGNQSNSVVENEVDDIPEDAISALKKAECDHTEKEVPNDTRFSFQQSPPGEELAAAVEEITGSPGLEENHPQKNVIRALSQRSDERLKFEYIGSFPFERVQDCIRSPRKHENVRTDGMQRILMVAEKPSIAKAIADALSGSRGPRQRRGISRGLPVYEFTTDQFQAGKTGDDTNTRSIVTVTSVVGHVFSLGFQEERDSSGGKRKNVDPSEYFRVPVVKQEEGSTGKLRVIDHLRALGAGMDHLVLWLDCDAEGENIAHEVIGVTRRALEPKIAEDRQLNGDGLLTRRIHRAKFSSITKEALKDAFLNLGEPDEKLSRSVDARQELDLRVGVAFTRLLTWRCVGFARKRFAASTKLVSYGPCQTPALSFCVDRAADIEGFTADKFTTINTKAMLVGQKSQVFDLRWRPEADGIVENNSKRGKITEESSTSDRGVARSLMEVAEHPQAYFIVTNVEEVPETIKAPVGLNTVALLSAGSRAMGMSPKGVLKVAEQLYSQGLVSYPRTESTMYDPNGFNVPRVLAEHSNHPDWGKTAGHLLRTKYSKSTTPPRRGVDVGDHPPITCLKSATRDDIGGGSNWRVYDFIARTFIGSLSDDLKFTRRRAKLELVSPLSTERNYCFEVENVSVNSPGFAAACTWVLRDIGAQRKESEHVELQQGMQLKLHSIKAEDRMTRPPPFLQEHELIELMDQNRIGTDASMATHVSNIVDRGYVVLCDETGVPIRRPGPPTRGKRPPRQVGRYLVPTPLGFGLINLFEGDASQNEENTAALLARPRIRAQMEEEVKTIAAGKLEKDACVDQNIRWFQERYTEFLSSLSRGRLGRFEASLESTNSALKKWRKLGAFEPSASSNELTNTKSRPAKKSREGTKKGKRTSHHPQGAKPGSKPRKTKQRAMKSFV